MKRFGFGFVTGYYMMPWGGFRKEGDTCLADDWIRVGFGITTGAGLHGNESMDEIYRGVLSQVIIGHGTPFVLERAHTFATLEQRKMIDLMVKTLQTHPTYKTLRKVRPI
jgi:hypothetical protein